MTKKEPLLFLFQREIRESWTRQLVMITRVVGIHTPEFSRRKQTRIVRNNVNAKGDTKIPFFKRNVFYLTLKHSTFGSFVLQSTASGLNKLPNTLNISIVCRAT